MDTSFDPPREPICRSAEDPRQPCPFATECNERRQRVMHFASPPIRGRDCWKYQQLMERSATPVQDADARAEREAIQAE